METRTRSWRRVGARLASRDRDDTKAPTAKSSGRLQTPSQRPLPPLVRLYIYALHGLLCEVAFTAAWDVCLTLDPRLPGHTSLWALPIYGSAVFILEKLSFRLRQKCCPLVARVMLYTGFIYLWEFSWGFTLKLFGACPWDYSHFPYNLLGLVTLEYAIPWALASLLAETLLVRYTLRLHLES